MQKFCRVCKKYKNTSEFYRRKTGPRKGSYYEKCKNCMKIRGKNYYYKNHTRQLRLAKERNRKTLIKTMRYLILAKNHPCVDCGKYFPPWAMDFDHIVSGTKTDNISSLRRFHSLKRIQVEISKCDLVCANCHRTRTMSRKKGLYYDIISEIESSGVRFKWKK